MPSSTEIETAALAHAPDWSSVQADILCPLCEYNLRGLIKPRCPECGHQFQWIEVLDRSRWEHPWLFEHARKRPVRSLIQTFYVSLFPRHFWQSVRPTQTPRVFRLILFWLIVGLLCGIPWTTAFPMARTYRDLYKTGHADGLPYRAQSRLGQKGYFYPRYSRTSYRANPTYLMPIPWKLYPTLWEVYEGNSGGHMESMIHWQLLLGLASWPWLTTATLLIFRQTMRQAKIKSSHVLRCAIYSTDIALLLAALLTTAIVRSSGWLMYSGVVYIDYFGSACLIAFVGLMTYRLSVAYRDYLTFPQPFATCALSQLVVALALLAVSGWHVVF